MTEPDARRTVLLARLEAALDVRLTGETAGDLADDVAARLGATEIRTSLRETAVALLAKVLADVSGRPEQDISEDTRIGALIPAMRRRLVWKQLGETLGAELPELERPWPVALVVFLAVLGLVSASLLSGGRFWSALGAGIGAWGVLGLVTKTVRTTIPSEVATVGDLADHLVLEKPTMFKPEGAPWSRPQILEVVLASVKNVYGLDEADETTRLEYPDKDDA